MLQENDICELIKEFKYFNIDTINNNNEINEKNKINNNKNDNDTLSIFKYFLNNMK